MPVHASHFARIQCIYLWRAGQAELTWVGGADANRTDKVHSSVMPVLTWPDPE